jgi:hypothetical protein
MPAAFSKIGLTALIFFTVVLRASSPSTSCFVLFEAPVAEPYSRLMNAIGFVETMNDNQAYNPREEAVGIFQIRPIRLEDYNRRTGSRYKMNDLFRYEISKKIFIYYAELIGPYNQEQIARNWNGSGHMTNYYWKRIREYI